MPVAELAERIKALKAAHTIEAAPTRTAARRIAAEVPVTARIRRRSEPAAEVETIAEPENAQSPEAMPVAEADAPVQASESEPHAVIHLFPEVTPEAQVQPLPSYRQHIAQRSRRDDRQLSLF